METTQMQETTIIEAGLTLNGMNGKVEQLINRFAANSVRNMRGHFTPDAAAEFANKLLALRAAIGEAADTLAEVSEQFEVEMPVTVEMNYDKEGMVMR